MYQGGLSKSEMEKSATRKFTARSPRVESRAKPIEEVIQPQSSSDEIVPSDDELEKIEQENSEIDMMNDVESAEATEEPTPPSETVNVSEVEETEVNTIEAVRFQKVSTQFLKLKRQFKKKTKQKNICRHEF